MSKPIQDIQQVLESLPHRYPFIMVDKVLECDPNKSIVAVKNVTISEPYFQGHFPGQPIMPGVLIIEALAQAVALMHVDVDASRQYLLVGIDKARFKRRVVPGDQLILKASLDQVKGNFSLCATQAFVDDTLVASAQLKTTFI